MKKQTETTGYISKSGKNGLYKIVARFTTPEGVKRVKLETFGDSPVQFWVDESKLCRPPAPERRLGEATKVCWECGTEFTYRECQYLGGTWSEDYCGC
ncbi:MAG: hypothetical protein LCH81_03580 [Bacteroidetes bacterium]|nr:hypothetical protein [Bacteroidota bacterium]